LDFYSAAKTDRTSKRINDRGRDDEKDVEKRLAGAGVEIAAGWQHYEHYSY